VHFAGWVRQQATYGCYHKAGVLVFPSVRDAGAGVVSDAMASGLPVIVACWGGRAHFIGGDAGIGLRVDSPQVLEDGIVDAVLGFLGDSASARELGRRAQERVAAEFVWRTKAERFLSIHREVLNE
jgi:glycosyltransferase involved in cell wall biosynthesis